MSSVNFEECCHKLMKMNIQEGQEIEVAKLIAECCGQGRTYENNYGLTAQRFCNLSEVY
jgi:pre-mRNA-splicing factor CWC22